MARILIVYETQEGHTETIAQFMADVLRQTGHETNTTTIDKLEFFPQYDAVILGASVHFGSFSLNFIDYIKKHLESLKMIPSAFFSVSMTAINHSDENTKKTQAYIDSLSEATGWNPENIASFAGALKYSEYGFLKRQLIKAIAKKEHLGVNTQQDFEYTDWEQVKQFTEAFASSLPVSDNPLINLSPIDLVLLEERGT